MTYIGIDVSKDYFDADLGSRGNNRYPTTTQGYARFMGDLPDHTHCIMESTGPYAWALADALHKADHLFSMVNALSPKRYSQALIQRAKTDKVDAKMLTMYGEKFTPKPTVMPEPYVLCLRQQHTLLQSLIKDRTAFLNRQHAFSYMPVQDETARKQLAAAIKFFNTQIESLRRAMKTLVKTHYGTLFALLMSIKGVGERTAIEMISVTNAFQGFTSAKQVLAYLGAAPRIVQSGTSVRGRGHISKIGHGQMRSLLYMCSLSASRTNKACHELYNRLIANHKPKMVALIAVVNKLVRQMFAVATSGKQYSEQYA